MTVASVRRALVSILLFDYAFSERDGTRIRRRSFAINISKTSSRVCLDEGRPVVRTRVNAYLKKKRIRWLFLARAYIPPTAGYKCTGTTS